MRKRDLARMGMFDRLVTFFSENAARVDSLPAFRLAVNAFLAKLTALKAAAEAQQAVSQGVTLGKKAKRLALCADLGILAGSVASYATATGRPELAGEMGLSDRDLARNSSTELVTICRRLLSMTTPHVAELADYGITAASLAELQVSIDTFETAKEAPRTLITERSGASDDVEALVNALYDDLDLHLDKIALRFSKTDNVFYNAYLGARKVVDPYTSTTRLVVEVRSLKDDAPLPAAEVLVDGTDIVVQTDAGGKCTIKGVEPGTRSVTIRHKDYTGKTIDGLVVKTGKATQVKAELA
jgi:hypothetical protein